MMTSNMKKFRLMTEHVAPGLKLLTTQEKMMLMADSSPKQGNRPEKRSSDYRSSRILLVVKKA